MHRKERYNVLQIGQHHYIFQKLQKQRDLLINIAHFLFEYVLILFYSRVDSDIMQVNFVTVVF